MSEPHVWLFDLDGTLIDSEELILDSFRHATATVLGETPSDEVLRRGIGLTLRAQVEALAPPALADELYTVYRMRNMERHADLLRSFEGIPEMLAGLRAAGRRLGIVTAKVRPALDLALHMIPIRDAFEVIVTAEDTTRHKPDPDPVLHALALMGAQPGEAIYVGDAPYDIRAGHAAGVTTAAALWGIFPREALLAEEPDRVYATPSEVRPA
ncbi:MAG: HAD family hydrolase [Gaiellales bacterium]